MPASRTLASMMPRLARWAAATFTLDARSLAVYRVGLGLLLLVDSLLRTRDFSLMFSPQGMFPLEGITAFHADPTLWSIAFWHDSSQCGGLVLAIQGLAGLAMIAGLLTRPATIVGWAALVSVVRRTAPTANAGDMWLICQMFWAMFLPLGGCWSLDARRAAGRGPAAAARREPRAVCSTATAALVLQLAAVYLGAGLMKCNANWLTGEAVAHALSVHDHGTPLGMSLSRVGWLASLATWAVPLAELGLPLLLLMPRSRAIRRGLVPLFMGFHALIWLTMSVGLFAPIGIVAWLPLIPAGCWPAASPQSPPVVGLGRAASWACAAAAGLAAVSFVHETTPWRTRPLPRGLTAALNLTGLRQVWTMFADVPPQEQWVYSRAELADGSLVDILRGGRPLETVRPAGGFGTLPHHRWHKFLWILPGPKARVLAAPTAAALARDWNEREPPARRITTLEIHFASQGTRGNHPVDRDILIASWPPRSPAGAGNLDRFLDAAGGATEPAAAPAGGSTPLTQLRPPR